MGLLVWPLKCDRIYIDRQKNFQDDFGLLIPSDIKDKPKDILKKMIGTTSGTLDEDDPLYQLLKSGIQ